MKISRAEFNCMPLAIRAQALQDIELLLNNDLMIPEPKVKMTDGFSNFDFDDEREPKGSTVMILPLQYTMVKWYTDMVNEYIKMAEDDDDIIGVILLTNTPGGSVMSMYNMEDTLKNRTKPIVALIDGQCCSAGMYVTSFCDHVMAINPMCEVGSIGAMISFEDDKGYFEKYGIKYIEVYPPESKDKNAVYREALAGNLEPITAYVSEYAKNFQNVMLRNRPINKEADGVLTGKTFFAKDAISLGLVDSIGSLSDAYNKVIELAKLRKELASLY